MATIKTTLHTFNFDTTTPEGLAAWRAFKSERESGPRMMGPVLADHWRPFRDLDGHTVELETAHLFGDQWNTAPIPGVSDKGLRVFDFTLQSDSAPHAPEMSAPRGIRRGHYLEQTEEMRAIRRDTMACGYCGKQEAAATAQAFCRHCLGSEYLTEGDLHLTRMRPVCDEGNRAPLTSEERAERLPLFRDAQLYGVTERDKARIAKERASIAAEFEKTTRDATTKRDALLWLMDRGIKTDNVIFYSHTGRFSFGWRKPLSADVVAALLAVISEFHWPYDLVCEDGRKLSGN